MLRKEQNDLVTQTGPDTPMGKLFRLLLAADPEFLGAAGERLSRRSASRSSASV